jgi:DNA-binding NarL/FixJ family response regulator
MLPRPPTPLARAAIAAPNGLTAREVEVLRLVAEGLSDALIAERLVIGPHTVNNLTSIYSKLVVSSRAAATRYAIEGTWGKHPLLPVGRIPFVLPAVRPPAGLSWRSLNTT